MEKILHFGPLSFGIWKLLTWEIKIKGEKHSQTLTLALKASHTE
jgi:hypothetical protein